MNISSVRIRICNSAGAPLGFASLVIDDAYVVYGIRIIRRKNGSPQILYPEAAHVRGKDGNKAYAFRPINSEAHSRIEKAILEAYQRKLKEM